MTGHEHYLDNAIWHSLTGPHAALALGDDVARRYPPDVVPFAGVALNDAYCLAAPGEILTLGAGDGLELTDDWTPVQQLTVHQMVHRDVARTRRLSPAAAAHPEELNHQRQREGLGAEEQRLAHALIQQYERAILVRAEAMARLKERDQDSAPLLALVTM